MSQVNDLVIHCIDFRFQELAHQWVADNLNGQTDKVVLAGASKAILDNTSRPIMLNQIKISQDLHAMKTIHLMDHLDCGAYGGSKAQPDKETEIAMHKDELMKAAAVIEEQFPDLTVKTYIMDFDQIIPITT